MTLGQKQSLAVVAIICGFGAIGCQTAREVKTAAGATVADLRGKAHEGNAEARGEVRAANTMPGEGLRQTGQPNYGLATKGGVATTAGNDDFLARVYNHRFNPVTRDDAAVPGVPSWGNYNGRSTAQLASDGTTTTAQVPVTTAEKVTLAEDSAEAAAAGGAAATAAVTSAPSPAVRSAEAGAAGERTSCGKLITEKSADAVGNPCLTTEDFLKSLHLSNKQQAKARRMVSDARATSASAH